MMVKRDGRLLTLTGLRWAAAVAVFGQHILEQFFNQRLDASKPIRSFIWAALVNGGAVGVSFFFVLSGFVLTWSARPGDRARTFWWRRFVKIYPATFVTTLAAIAVVGGVSTTQIVTHLTLSQSWTSRADIFAALNPVTWSLAVEVFFYLCFPLLLSLLRPVKPIVLWSMAVMMVEIVVAAAVILVHLDHTTAMWLAYIFPPVRLAEFILGIVVALLVRADAWRGPGLRWALPILGVATGAGLLVPFPVNQHALTLIPVAMVVAAAARADLSGARTFWSRPGMLYLGNLSFAFYLVHLLVIIGADRLGLLPQHAPLPVALLVTSLLFAASFVAAMLVHHGVELPAARLLRADLRLRSDTRTPPARHRAARHRAVRGSRRPVSSRPVLQGQPVLSVPIQLSRTSRSPSAVR
ncbi:acyltransferase [Dactylosporangium sp. NPDC005572]|uniref:acyltransferase family protein n=1 Tax=Dactylosporangium sp. NPDC005572 TaxID=3156889 RepID=UPI0033B76EF7